MGRRASTVASSTVDPDAVLEVCATAASAVTEVLGGLDDWGLAGTCPGQYKSDLVADDAAIEVLSASGFGVLSEESGLHAGSGGLLAVLDPVDGSTNASRGIPWFATSICVLDDEGPLVALVVNQASGVRYQAVRGGGARRDGEAIAPTAVRELRRAIVGLSGYPPRHLGWRQYRALGAVALDLCAVAEGMLDGYVDCAGSSHASWDYLGGMLVCQEAGAAVADAAGRDLVVREAEVRRNPVAGSTPELLEALLEARRRSAEPATG